MHISTGGIVASRPEARDKQVGPDGELRPLSRECESQQSSLAKMRYIGPAVVPAHAFSRRYRLVNVLGRPEEMPEVYAGIFDRSDIDSSIFAVRCSQVVSRLEASSDSALLAALADPREIHKCLYYDIAPEPLREAAGNFRGSEYPSLKNSVVFHAFNATEGTTNIASPHEVHDLMDQYSALMKRYGLRAVSIVEQKLATLAPLMALLGFIHPFRDGNGHIQRITFQCLIERAGFEMAPIWRLHPCPYGEDVHRALAALNLSKVAALMREFVQ